MLKKLLIALGALICLFLVALAFVFYKAGAIPDKIANPDEALVIHLKPGQTASSVWRMLPISVDKAQSLWFRVFRKMQPEYARVKAGYYEFAPDSTVEEIFTRIIKADETLFSITLVEGLTLNQWLAFIESTVNLHQDLPPFNELYSKLKTGDSNFCENPSASLEGCLLPDTYFYAFNDSALSILKRAFEAMDANLDRIWQERFQDIPIEHPYEALILASIIEKETAVDAERGLIAGVFSNRLELGMRLQTDPTVIYGIIDSGEAFDGNITRTHLREKTRYNTYRIDGLPPTPIAMPSLASLEAAVKPDLTDYLYFVAKGDGSHEFSQTLEEHNQAVSLYQLKRKQNTN
uniref:endolytic transglycosylase MltG n=1 Tax=Ningiella ruwaisensis TaxID=2364274 RepID=UPI0010A00847|nr:endolytic transglycosylase MltG [Ningiella ruwaisensis]